MANATRLAMIGCLMLALLSLQAHSESVSTEQGGPRHVYTAVGAKHNMPLLMNLLTDGLACIGASAFVPASSTCNRSDKAGIAISALTRIVVARAELEVSPTQGELTPRSVA